MAIKVQEKNNQIVNQTRKSILKYLDGVCSEYSLQYFAFAKLLVGAVYYQDFIPDGFSSMTEIGLMRKDYDKLVRILAEDAEKEGFHYDTQLKNGAPGFQCRVIKDIYEEREDIILKGSAEVVISAFDFVPDSPAQRKAFYRSFFFKRERYLKLAKRYRKSESVSLKPKALIRLVCNKWRYRPGTLSKKYKRILKRASAYRKSAYIRRLVPSWSQEVPYNDIFPVKRVPFEDIEINLPNNHTWWAVEIDDALMTRTRTIQQIDLAIIKEFDRVCRLIGVGYFVCGGTMLGYMRHRGFIPWDDDMDVGMLRADYDKFLREAPEYLSPDFFLQTRETDRKIPYLFSKIRMNETEYITHYNELRDFHKGICLDLFPFDYIPNGAAAQEKFRSSVKRVEKIHNMVVNKQIEKPVYDSPARSFAEIKARCINEIRRRITHLVPLTLTQKLYIKTATKYNARAKKLKLTTVASFVPTYTFDTVKDMIPYQDVEFEGVTVMALKDMDKFLTMQYGDYMQLPALHKRVGHDLINWSISDSMAEKYHINTEG